MVRPRIFTTVALASVVFEGDALQTDRSRKRCVPGGKCCSARGSVGQGGGTAPGGGSARPGSRARDAPTTTRVCSRCGRDPQGGCGGASVLSPILGAVHRFSCKVTAPPASTIPATASSRRPRLRGLTYPRHPQRAQRGRPQGGVLGRVSSTLYCAGPRPSPATEPLTPPGGPHSPGEGWWAGGGEAKSSLSLRSSSFSLCHCRPTFSQRLAAASLRHDTRVRRACGRPEPRLPPRALGTLRASDGSAHGAKPRWTP